MGQTSSSVDMVNDMVNLVLGWSMINDMVNEMVNDQSDTLLLGGPDVALRGLFSEDVVYFLKTN